MRDIGTLLEALPYIREFHSKTVVIKYGGAAMEDRDLSEEFARDVVLLKYVGLNPIVVHGGGPDITRYMERLALPVEFVDGLRVSDESTVEIAKMVLVGKVNKDIVLRLSRHGQPAVGLSGDDGSLFRVARRPSPGGEDIGFVGRIPPPRRGSASRTCSSVACAMSEPGSAGSRNQPGTSVRNSSLYAPSAPATAPAASSALTLYECPSRSAPTEAITGM